MNRDIVTELLQRGLVDILQLAEIASVVRSHVAESSEDSDVLSETLEVITHLLASGYATAGDVVRDQDGLLHIRSWGLSPSDTVKRIEDEWRALGRLPNLGEVCWLELTDAGRAEARAISS
jgi:hypothetical protein